MKIIKNINLKNLVPGIISLMLIAGMAASTLATNIDLEAFVRRDDFLAKYNELDWRVDDIEKSLDRLYKFTCTNVKTFGGISQGGYPTNYYPPAFPQGSFNSSYPEDNYIVAFFDDPKYLRVNKKYSLTYGGTGTGGTYKTHSAVFKRDFPATMCKWKEGIELYPETKVYMTLTNNVPDASSVSTVVELVMGPFKKFPNYTAGGSTVTTGYICELPVGLVDNSISGTTTFYYQYGTKTYPTSWQYKSDTSTYLQGGQTSGTVDNSKFPVITSDDIVNWGYSFRNKRMHTKWYFQSATAPNLSSYDNVWLRYYYSASHSFPTWVSMGDFELTTWNTGK